MGRRKILIVDDHPILRKGLAMVIDSEPDLKVVGEAQEVQGALEKIESLAPDLSSLTLPCPGSMASSS